HCTQNFVTWLEVGFAPTASHQVDRGGGALRKDDFTRMSRTNEPGHLLAGRFVLLGTSLTQGVNAPVNVGVVVFVDARNGIDDLPGALGAGGVIEKHERLAVEHVA